LILADINKDETPSWEKNIPSDVEAAYFIPYTYQQLKDEIKG